MKRLRILEEGGAPAKPDQHLEQVEWLVCKISPDGSRVRHSEGAQTVFGPTRARQVVKELGGGWVIRHVDDDTPPQEP